MYDFIWVYNIDLCQIHQNRWGSVVTIKFIGIGTDKNGGYTNILLNNQLNYRIRSDIIIYYKNNSEEIALETEDLHLFSFKTPIFINLVIL